MAYNALKAAAPVSAGTAANWRNDRSSAGRTSPTYVTARIVLGANIKVNIWPEWLTDVSQFVSAEHH
jgi:hypothetical protein